ncbi:MAG: protein kinase domain-containing protein, partial [Candidatus Sericytochromatia bacterium]
MPDQSPMPPSQRFTLLGELGRGAMGLVYRAADAQREGEVVALKTIRSQGPVTADQRLAFKEEFRAMARLAHPNLIQVHDYGQLDDETQFLTMEIVTGDDLDQRMGQGPMPLEAAYPLLIQLLQALAFIHSRRYVHRDIKPRNIRVSESGTLKLMDFGLMRQLGLAGGSTGLTGAPGYMSPEAIQGGVIGAYSDLYSVGCIAFEMITGHPPFEGSMSEVLRAHLKEAPPPMRVPGGRVPGGRVPPRLQKIVARLLEKDPESRYRDANEVLTDLASLAGLDVARTNLDQKASYLTSDALVGREHELGALRRAFDQALAGEGASVFIGAPAGVGKSRLTQEFLIAAKLEEAIVLTGSCQERGQAPYEPLVKALKPLVAAFPPSAQPVASLLAGEPVEKEALKDGLVDWLRDGAARRPIVLAIEDLHWCDPQSLEALNHVVRHVSGHRLLVLGTFRHDETPPGSPVWYTIEEEASTHLKLAAFDANQVLALLRATLREVTITREFHQFLYDATAGNAFFLIEVLRYLMEEGVLTQSGGSWHFPQEPGPVVLPRSLEATVTRRLAHLSPGAHQLASAAAVTGPRQDLPILLAVSGLDEEALFLHLDELVERQFICRDPQGYAFPHSRVREALYEALDPETRRMLHARCGLALEARDAGVDALAYHFRRGEDMPRAYTYMRKAATQAERAGADAVALDYLEQAEAVLSGLDRPDKQAELAALWWEIGVSAFVLTPAPAIAAFEKLLPALESAGDPRLVDALQMLSIAYALLGRPIKGLEVHDRALARMPDRHTPAYAAVLTARCASQLTGGLYDELLET